MVSQDTQCVQCISKEKFNQLQMVLSLRYVGIVIKSIKWRQIHSQVVKESNERRNIRAKHDSICRQGMEAEGRSGDGS